MFILYVGHIASIFLSSVLLLSFTYFHFYLCHMLIGFMQLCEIQGLLMREACCICLILTQLSSYGCLQLHLCSHTTSLSFLRLKKNLLCMNITFSLWSFKKGTQINLTTMVHLTSVRKCMIHSSIIRSPYFGQLINLRTFSCFLAHGEYELFLAF